MNQCAICGQPMTRLIPAGVSKTTGKPYQAFYVCEVKEHKQPRSSGAGLVTPLQKFTGELNQMNQGKKWEDISRGKVRHGFAVEAFKLGMELNVGTAAMINGWTSYVMSGKIANQMGDPEYVGE